MENNRKIGVLLVNLGTPKSYQTTDVRRYLRQFLSDGRVIDIPFLARFALVNFIIAPFRAPKSAKEYQKLWTEKGSPLMFHGKELLEKVRQKLGNNFEVELAMRYQEPSVEQTLQNLLDKNISELIVFPLFPQYASATTGSVHEEVMRILSKKLIIPKLKLISAYPDSPKMLETFVQIAQRKMAAQTYEHFVFTFHGLPERHLKKENKDCLRADCCEIFGNHNRYCYRAQCFLTAKKIAEKLHLKADEYTVCFQSRLGKDPWIQPYTENIVKDLAKKGKKSILVFTPSFVADCLETTVEVGETYKELFEHESKGGMWDLAPSLNSEELWAEAVAEMLTAEAQCR
jgi:ferrochelatase